MIKNSISIENDDLFKVTELNGYLPLFKPLEILPQDFHIMEKILQKMQFYQQDNTLGLLGQKRLADSIINELPDYYSTIIKIKDKQLLTALFRDYGFLVSGYLLEDCHHQYLLQKEYGLAKELLPLKLAKPFYHIAQEIGAQPWLDYSRGMVLNNFKMIDPSKGFVYENLRLIRQFTGLQSERGFYLTHVMVASKSPKMIQLINKVLDLLNLPEIQRNEINHCLVNLTNVIDESVQEMKCMFHRNQVDEYYTFLTFMFGIKGQLQFPNGVIFEGVDKQPLYIKGPSAALDLTMPILDIFFGLTEIFPDTQFKQHLTEYRAYMPAQNLIYLENLLEKRKTSGFIDFCLQDHETLLYYLKCIDGIRRFRETHWNFVQEYLIKRQKLSIGSSGTNPVAFIPVPIISITNYVLQKIKFYQNNLPQNDMKINTAYIKLEKITQKAKDKIENIVQNLNQQICNFKNQTDLLQSINPTNYKQISQQLDLKDPLTRFRIQHEQEKQLLNFGLHKYINLSLEVDTQQEEQDIDINSQILLDKLSFLVGAFDHELSLQNSMQNSFSKIIDILEIKCEQLNTILILSNGQIASKIKHIWSQKVTKPQIISINYFNQTNEQGFQNILDIIDENQNVDTILVDYIDNVSGSQLLIEHLIKICHQKKILVILEVSISMGQIQLSLHDWNVDFALFNFKNFLNVETNSLFGFFVNQKLNLPFKSIHENIIESEVSQDFRTINKKLDLFLQGGPHNIWTKHSHLYQFMYFLLKQFENVNIMNKDEKIGQFISFSVMGQEVQTQALYNHLLSNNVDCEFILDKGIIQLWFSAFYNTFEECCLVNEQIHLFFNKQ